MRIRSSLLVPAFISIGFVWLWPHLFGAEANDIYAGFRTVWSDFAAHLTFAQRFARFPSDLWFDHNPLFYGARFDYPFLTGLISGGLLRLTGSEVVALLVPTIVAAAILPWVIYAFLRTAHVTAPWAAVGTLVFYLGGGLGWTVVLSTEVAVPAHMEASMVPDTLFQFGRLVHLLLPQRALQLGIPLGLLTIMGLARLIHHTMVSQGRALAPNRWSEWAAQILLGAGAGLLYIVHIHSFLAVAVTTIVMIAVSTFFNNAYNTVLKNVAVGQRLLHFAPFAITATLISLSLFYWSSDGVIRRGFLQFDPGWLVDDFNRWLGFWWCNGGIFYLAAAYALFTRRLWRSPSAALWAVAGWTLFAMINLIRLQPWDWDNTKLEIWAFILLLPGVMILMQSWWQVGIKTVGWIGWGTRCATLVVVLSLLPTGLLDLDEVLSFQRHTNVMWSADQRALASKFTTLMSPGDVILTADRSHDWVSGLAGGQILMGYTGWLWTYGIDYKSRQQNIRTMFQGDGGALELLRSYNVSWVVLDDEARQKYQANEDFLAAHFQPVLQQGNTTIYDLRHDPDGLALP